MMRAARADPGPALLAAPHVAPAGGAWREGSGFASRRKLCAARGKREVPARLPCLSGPFIARMGLASDDSGAWSHRHWLAGAGS